MQPVDDSSQSFVHHAATVRANGSGDFTPFFTPDQPEPNVGFGGWDVPLPILSREQCFGG
ncbi:MAG: hypothetical protein ACI89X_001205 [Planctomycetota bacterium]